LQLRRAAELTSTSPAAMEGSPSAASSSSSSSVVVLSELGELDTATSPYFADGGDAGVAFGPTAEQTKSALTSVATLRSICNKYGIPNDYTPRCANNLAACTPPPEGSNALCVYAAALDAGMRFPLHDFYLAVLKHYGLAPTQLKPNAWRYMAGFVSLCEDAGVAPLLSVFQYFFSICVDKKDGWHHFTPCLLPPLTSGGGGGGRLFTGGKMPSYAGWKSRFFFVEPPPATAWPCSSKWGRPFIASVIRPVTTSDAVMAIRALQDRAGSTGIDIMAFLAVAGRNPPVGHRSRVLATPKQAAVKMESTAAAAAAWMEQTSRKRKSPEPVITPPYRRSDVGPAARSGGEHSAAICPGAARELLHWAQRSVVEFEMEQQELQVARDEVAQLKEAMRVARDEHGAEVLRLKDELAVARAQLQEEVGRITKELEEAKSKHKDEVRAVKTQSHHEVISLKHKSHNLMMERYSSGLEDMRKLVLDMYPGVVNPNDLRIDQLLSDSCLPPQAPMDGQ
jgi:hypothetical protein